MLKMKVFITDGKKLLCTPNNLLKTNYLAVKEEIDREVQAMLVSDWSFCFTFNSLPVA